MRLRKRELDAQCVSTHVKNSAGPLSSSLPPYAAANEKDGNAQTITPLANHRLSLYRQQRAVNCRRRMNSGNFFAELKRRNVYKVAVAYIVGGWALSQGIAQVLPVFDVPNWIIRLLVVLIIIGFPIALIFAWSFEITPEGVKRADDVDVTKPHTVHGPWIYIVVVGAAVSISLFFLGRYTAPNRIASGDENKSIAVLPFAT